MAVPIQKMLDFSGKTVIVTGGRAGLGSGIAKRFAETGANVVTTYRTEDPAHPAAEVVAEIEKRGAKGLAIRTDVRDAARSREMIAKAAEVFGRVDMLVNNAGIYPHHDLLTVGEAEWDDMHQSNLRGAFFCAQAAANQMIRQGTGGAIVNILSINAFRPMADGLVYGSSKAGLEMVTRCMAFELGKYGIRVNAVAPGLIDAPGLDQNVPGWRERYSDRAPLGRIAQHVDIADVCIFCCSELSAWVTGETILADGGVMLAEAY